ncbi:hypothetical protein [Herbaspirillum robiniae]|uniref:hypothetical protein n=1 Tax=Herbaspirillum robiniae TaxID=2014887 RepID=UPI0009A1E1DB|nr:hypothetical protein [Herbaspirillum robiniae]
MKLDRFDQLDLSIALNVLYKLELNEGDLGREYWRQIAELLKDAGSFRQRALVAEEQLRSSRGAISRRSSEAKKTTGLSLKERRRIADKYPRDVARIQRVLLAAGHVYVVDEMIVAWNEYSNEEDVVWMELPDSDAELLLKLLGVIGA